MHQPFGTPPRALPLLAALLALAATGCGLTSRSRLEDARGRVRVLQAENEQLRDVVTNVRSQNRDLAQRSAEDARRLRALEVANERYERSLAAYQEERDQLVALLEQIRSQVRTAALAPPTTAMLDRLDAFARQVPGARLDHEAGRLELPAPVLFGPGSATPTAEGLARLDALAEALGGPEAAGLALSVAGPVDPDLGAVRRTSAGVPDQGPDTLSLERARKVRDRLAARSAIDPARVAVSGVKRVAPPLGGDGLARAGGTADEPGAVVLRIRRLADPEPPATPPEAPGRNDAP